MSRSRSRSPARSRTRSRSPPRRSRDSPPKYSKKEPAGDRENPSESNVIGIFGMSRYTDERKLRDICERYGRVDKCVVVMDRDRQPRGFAFVTFESVDDAAEARSKLNGKDIDGREVRVDYSITKRAHSPTPGQYMGRETRRRDDRDRRGGYRDRSRDRRDSYSSRRRSRSPAYRRRSPSPYRSRR